MKKEGTYCNTYRHESIYLSSYHVYSSIHYTREEIFSIHTREMRENGILSTDVNLKELAANTTRFSGAEIAGVVRGAASYALERKVSSNYRIHVAQNF